ncbi:hypothetical protein [Nocardia otitidiscaviarum]|uniref:hypothetical protein n=1 Tax=Nocardia otitidiscaviarum TaxID=1823 RepID=UPI0004A75FD6|nr:hypothetical protein [Nocardia otitidiscaviarum]
MSINHIERAEWNLVQADRHPAGSDASTEHTARAMVHGLVAVAKSLQPRSVDISTSIGRHDAEEEPSCRA